MSKPIHNRAFSLAELLVAMAILAVVVSIIAPRFLRIQAQADTVAKQDGITRINSAFRIWEAAGGRVGASASTSDILRILGSEPGTVLSYTGTSLASTADDVADSAIPTGNSTGTSSSSIRVQLPSTISVPGTSSPVVSYGNDFIAYSSATSSFKLLPSANIANLGIAIGQMTGPTFFTTGNVGEGINPATGIVVQVTGSTIATTGKAGLDSSLNNALSRVTLRGNGYYRISYEPNNPAVSYAITSPGWYMTRVEYIGN